MTVEGPSGNRFEGFSHSRDSDFCFHFSDSEIKWDLSFFFFTSLESDTLFLIVRYYNQVTTNCKNHVMKSNNVPFFSLFFFFFLNAHAHFHFRTCKQDMSSKADMVKLEESNLFLWEVWTFGFLTLFSFLVFCRTDYRSLLQHGNIQKWFKTIRQQSNQLQTREPHLPSELSAMAMSPSRWCVKRYETGGGSNCHTGIKCCK